MWYNCQKSRPSSKNLVITQHGEDKVNRYIREKIREAREQRGRTQDELAKELERSRVAVSAMERGKAQVNASDLVIIASSLEKPIAYFYPPVVVGPTGVDLSAKEQELVWMFRRLQPDTLENVALSPIAALAESALQSDPEAHWEEAKVEAQEKGIQTTLARSFGGVLRTTTDRAAHTVPVHG
jgi:transcriptional regulator with XRE-family HTH domain